MPESMKRIYANAIRAKTTPNEFILEFGTFFPANEAEGKSGPPPDFPFELQIVMNANQLSGLSASLIEMQKLVAAAIVAAAPQVKRSN